MSYSLAFFAAPVDELVSRMTAAGVTGATDRFEQRTYDLVQELGRPVDAITHSSSGGKWFRDQFIHTALARIIGAESAGFLLDRPLAGIEWDYQPSFGWLTKAELDDAIARLDEADEDVLADLDDEESEEALETLVDILRMAAMSGQDVVTVYD
jgi:hypothetical protein